MVFGLGGRDEEVTVQISGDSSGLTDAVNSAEGALLSLEATTATAGLALSALATGALAKATESAMAFESAMVELEKVTTPETAEAMSGSIQELAGEMPIAQQALADITAEAGRLGVRGSESLERFTRTVGEMAIATDLTEQEAATAFARLSKLTQTPIDRVRNLGAVINALSNRMAITSSGITDGATRSAAALNQLGLQTDQIFALNAALGAVSESSERSGTRLRRLGQELLSASGDSAEELATALGLTVEEFTQLRDDAPLDLITRMVAVMDSGGERARALGDSLSTVSRQALAGLAQNADGFGQALSVANEQMAVAGSLSDEYETASDTLNNKLQVTRNRVRNIAITTGGALLPAVKGLVDTINGGLGAIQDFNESTGGMAVSIGLAGAAVGGLVGGLAKLASFLGFAESATAALGAVVSGLSAPVIAVVGAVVALGAAFATNFADIRDITGRVLGELGEMLGRIVDALGLTGVSFSGVLDDVGLLADEIGDHLAPALDSLATKFVAVADIAVTAIVQAIEAMKGLGAVMGAVLAGDFERARTIFDDRIDSAQDAVGRLNERIRGRFGALRERNQRRSRGLSATRPDAPGGAGGPAFERPQTPRGTGDDESSELSFMERFRKYQESVQAAMEQGTQAQQGAMDEAAKNTRRTAEALEGSSVIQGGVCSLRENLLGPLERTPRPAAPRRRQSRTIEPAGGIRGGTQPESPAGGGPLPVPGSGQERKVVLQVDSQELATVVEDASDQYIGAKQVVE